MRPGAARLAVCLLAASGVASVHAQTQAPPPCSPPENRQFDFWIGSWDVFNPDGQLVGVNTIDTVYAGCALWEQWESRASPSRGGSYNIYDRLSGRWHQTWVDNSGTLLLLDGGLEGRSMVLSGESPNREGGVTLHRITWTPLAPDSVRQHWETSTDQGGSWSTAFDGRYVRRR